MQEPKSQRLQFISSLLSICVGCGLLVAGFIVAPTGQIHNSVLIAFGEILTFIGTVTGIDYKHRFK